MPPFLWTLHPRSPPLQVKETLPLRMQLSDSSLALFLLFSLMNFHLSLPGSLFEMILDKCHYFGYRPYKPTLIKSMESNK